MPHKFTKGQKVIDSISGEEVTINCEDKSGAYWIEAAGIEWVLWRNESDLKEVGKVKKAKKTK